MYAIVKTGGKQYKVAEGDVLEVEKLSAATGDEVALPAVLLVDGDTVTHDAEALATVAVTAEVLAQVKGPKIRIHKFKNKTRYHKRMGHRQQLTKLQVTEISAGGKSTTSPAAKSGKSETTASKAQPSEAADSTPAKAADAGSESADAGSEQ
jgi:large subunit ribosomal protein L21